MMTKRLILAILVLATAHGAWAETRAPKPTNDVKEISFPGKSVQFSAQVDRDQISQDETVTLKMVVRTEGTPAAGQVLYSAPDFEEINSYSRQPYPESYYENGRFGVRHNQQVIKVLKPKKQGTLKIAKIQLKSDKGTFTAPDIVLQVGPSGPGTPPMRGYGSGAGLRTGGKQITANNFFVKAEVNRQSVYKGEQIVVSYYFYSSARFANIIPEKYPELKGFLKEPLDSPLLNPRASSLKAERVAYNGRLWERALLLSYAAYPLQEGKLSVDALSVKFNYFPGSGNTDLDEDPFARAFTQHIPSTSQARSETINIEVKPLPQAGKPESFTGGVGDFSISSAVDRYELRANDAVSLKVKVEGRGNLAAITEPKAKWPDNVELYETKSNVKVSPSGLGEKVFELLLIPRAPGAVQLPALEFSYFDPARGQYVTRKTEPIALKVQEPAPGSAYTAKKTEQGAASADKAENKPAVAQAEPEQLRPLMLADSPAQERRLSLWPYIIWLSLAVFVLLLVLVIFDLLRKGQAIAKANQNAKAHALSRSWQRLYKDASAAQSGAAWDKVHQAYEVLCGVLFDAIDKKFTVSSRSLSRTELKAVLVDEKGLDEALWGKAAQVLEFAESVRFALNAGVSEEQARQALQEMVATGENFAREIEKI